MHKIWQMAPGREKWHFLRCENCWKRRKIKRKMQEMF